MSYVTEIRMADGRPIVQNSYDVRAGDNAPDDNAACIHWITHWPTADNPRQSHQTYSVGGGSALQPQLATIVFDGCDGTWRLQMMAGRAQGGFRCWTVDGCMAVAAEMFRQAV